jgi:hypothetical protein
VIGTRLPGGRGIAPAEGQAGACRFADGQIGQGGGGAALGSVAMWSQQTAQTRIGITT